MNQLEFNITGNKITVVKLPCVTSGSANYDECKFNFDSQWDKLSKTAVFICSALNSEYTSPITNGICNVPKECLQKSGTLKIGAVGVGESGTVISTNIAVHKITVGANESVQITAFEPDDSSSGFDSAEETAFEEELSEWADSMYTSKESDIGSLDFDSLKTQNENYLTATFSRLAKEHPDYVSEASAGEDSYGKNIPVFTFTGKDFDRTIFVYANYTHGTYMTSAALGGFFGALCKRNSADKNLNFLYNKVKFIVLPAAAPTAYENENGLNKNNVKIDCNFPYKWNLCSDESKGTASASEKETVAVMNALENVSSENIVAACSFLSKNISAEKHISYPSIKFSDEDLLLKVASKFDCLNSEDEENATVLTPDSSPCFTNFAAESYRISSCSVVWRDDLGLNAVVKYSSFIGNLFLSFAKKCKVKGESEPMPFTKHIYWRQTNNADAISLTESIAPAYISSFLAELDASCSVTMNGYVILKSDSGASVTVRPVLYQQNADEANLAVRQSSDEFDISVPILSGVSVIPLNAVIHCTKSCSSVNGSSFSQKLGAFIAASCTDGSAQIVGFSYTVCVMPCGASASTQVLTPNGLASDYNSENASPVFTIKYPVG